MESKQSNIKSICRIHIYKLIAAVSCILFLFSAGGCNALKDSPVIPYSQLEAFHQAGPITFTLDTDRLLESSVHSGPYQIIPGDTLEFQMPLMLQMVTSDLADAETGQLQSYTCRVENDGTISMPIIGRCRVAGKSLARIEKEIKAAYYPKYVRIEPQMVVTVSEYRTFRVSVRGAVNKPGIYYLQNDQMSLVNLLMEAGGIVNEGASVITITHADGTREVNTYSNTEPKQSSLINLAEEQFRQAGQTKPILLPVREMNTPFKDVTLQEGDRVNVKGFKAQTFTVLGLVKKQGAYPYPVNARYSLLEALGYAGGVDEVADPHYARIYRQTVDGKVIDATFGIKDKIQLAQALGVTVKPGDVIVVEHTGRTRLNLLLADILQIRAGLGAQYLFYAGKDVRQLERYD